MIRHHSAIGTAAWTDLLRMLKDEGVSGLRGTPTLKTIGHRRYWYDRYRLGNEVVDRYLGEDAPELRERLARHAEIAQELKESQRQRARPHRALGAQAEGGDPGDPHRRSPRSFSVSIVAGHPGSAARTCASTVSSSCAGYSTPKRATICGAYQR